MFVPRTIRFAAFFAAAFSVALFSSSASLGQKEKEKEPPKKAEEKKPADGKKVKSKIKITVPQDDAELKIEKKDTKPTGAVREFETPDIDSGKPYEYEFSVTWRPNNYTVLTRTKAIEFRAAKISSWT